jgi:hypothetical protein
MESRRWLEKEEAFGPGDVFSSFFLSLFLSFQNLGGMIGESERLVNLLRITRVCVGSMSE